MSADDCRQTLRKILTSVGTVTVQRARCAAYQSWYQARAESANEQARSKRVELLSRAGLAAHVMIGNRRDLMHPLPRYAVALFDRQWMSCWLKLDLGPKTNCLSMDHCLEIERFRVARNRVRQPTEIGRLSLATRCVPKVQASLE